MKKLNRDQAGFSAVETILIIVIVAIVGFVGWFVYHSKQNSDKALDAATSTNQNAGPRFKSKVTKPSTTSTPAAATSTTTKQ